MWLKNYIPHEGQRAFHYAVNCRFDYVALITGIRGGKTWAGAREAGRQAWNEKKNGVYLIVAPTYNMLDRTTWVEFKDAIRPLISTENDSKKIITLKNGRRVHGHSAENPERIRNETACGFWIDEARGCKDFQTLWDILLGRVLSTGGRGFITTSPNSFDDIHKIFVAERKKNYGVVRYSTYQNTYVNRKNIDQLKDNYDAKFAEQEISGEFVIFDGAVYYSFRRADNAGDLAFKVANYTPDLPIHLNCDFNVDPMAWTMFQIHKRPDELAEVRVFDEIFIRNSNTVQCCQEFKTRYPNHNSGLVLCGDATGHARHTDSNVTNWKIIKNELDNYGLTWKVPTRNPAERDRVNSVNAMICNSKGIRRTQVNPKKCPNTVRDLEQVSYKEGTTQIDKTKNLMLSHPSDSLGYGIEAEFSLDKYKYSILKI